MLCISQNYHYEKTEESKVKLLQHLTNQLEVHFAANDAKIHIYSTCTISKPTSESHPRLAHAVAKFGHSLELLCASIYSIHTHTRARNSIMNTREKFHHETL